MPCQLEREGKKVWPRWQFLNCCLVRRHSIKKFNAATLDDDWPKGLIDLILFVERLIELWVTVLRTEELTNTNLKVKRQFTNPEVKRTDFLLPRSQRLMRCGDKNGPEQPCDKGPHLMARKTKTPPWNRRKGFPEWHIAESHLKNLSAIKETSAEPWLFVRRRGYPLIC